MSDKELLELAAKAAGIELEWPQDYGGADHLSPHDTSTRQIWNPLTDDGDALRLVVRLQIDLKLYDDYVVAWFDGGCIGTGRIPYDGDPYAATRRAIVCAAAEIGKSNHGDK